MTPRASEFTRKLPDRRLLARRLETVQDGFCTITEAAQFLGVDRHVIESMLRSGELPVMKLGPRQTRIPIRGLHLFCAMRLRW